jgi:hypothetical protein
MDSEHPLGFFDAFTAQASVEEYRAIAQDAEVIALVIATIGTCSNTHRFELHHMPTSFGHRSHADEPTSVSWKVLLQQGQYHLDRYRNAMDDGRLQRD